MGDVKGIETSTPILTLASRVDLPCLRRLGEHKGMVTPVALELASLTEFSRIGRLGDRIGREISALLAREL